jgi:hypothetical protein
MVDLVEACLYEAMRLFRVHIQAVQVGLLLTLPVYIPCTPGGGSMLMRGSNFHTFLLKKDCPVLLCVCDVLF